MNDSTNNHYPRNVVKKNQMIFEALLKFLLGGILLVFIFFALGLGLIRIWLEPQIENVLTDPEKINRLLPSIVVEKNIKVEINTVKIDWSKWLSPTLVLEGIEVNRNENLRLLTLNKLKSVIGLKSFVKFWQKIPITNDIDIDEATFYIQKKQTNELIRMLLASIPLILTKADNEKKYLYFSPKLVQINQINLNFERFSGANELKNKFISLGSARITNLNNQLEALFEGLTINSILSVSSIIGISSRDYETYQGVVNTLLFKLPKNLKQEFNSKKNILDSVIVEGKFENLGIITKETQKGFFGLSGSFLLDSSALNLKIYSKNAQLFFPKIFTQQNVNFSNVDARINLDSTGFEQILSGRFDQLPINILDLKLSNSDVNIHAYGLWILNEHATRKIDFEGDFSFSKPENIPKYLPKQLNPKLRGWFERGIKSADAVDGSFSFNGPSNNSLKVSENKKIDFKANVNIKNLDLLFSSKWPAIKNINSQIEFNNEYFRVIDASGFLGKSKLISVNGDIPNIFSKKPELSLTGGVSGSFEDFIVVSNSSPISKWLWGVTKNISGYGKTELDLSLLLKLKKIHKSEAKGSLKLKNTSILFGKNFLPLDNVAGEIKFTEKTLSSLNIKSEIFGGNVIFSNTKSSNFKKGVYLRAIGVLEGQGFENWTNNNFEINMNDKIVGNTEYSADIKLLKGAIDLELNTNLKGILINLPKPFYKDSEKLWALKANFLHKPNDQKKDWKNESKIQIDNGFTAYISQTYSKDNFNKNILHSPKRFAILYDEKKSENLAKTFFENFSKESENKIAINNSTFNLKSWINFTRNLRENPKKGFIENLLIQPCKIQLRTENLSVLSRNFTNFYTQALATNNGLSGIFRSVESTGVFNWTKKPNNLRAHLSHYYPSNFKKNDKFSNFELSNHVSFNDVENWPSINLFIDDFKIYSFQGKFVLDANYLKSQKTWNIERVKIYSNTTKLDAKGFWNKAKTPVGISPKVGSETEIDFRIDTKNGANLLKDFGYSGLLTGSAGVILGQLKWLGSPLDFKVKNTSGNLSLDLQEGKFLKVEPGIARLIGVLNLQSLPKRIKLDFGDIFSEGFSYDKLRGDVYLDLGVANTKNLRVVGTQASVFLEGNVDLLDQTQDMRILVLPELNAGLASLGYVLVNPAVGLGSFLAQYILRDPLRKILAYEYKLKGSWDNPVVKIIPQKKTTIDDSSVYKNQLEKID